MSVALCDEIGAKLRNKNRDTVLNVRDKPSSAPETFLTPEDVKSILKTGPVEELFLCRCETCRRYSNYTAEQRKVKCLPKELMGKYATMFALLLMEKCGALIWEFQRKDIHLDRRLYQEDLDFLLPLLTQRWPKTPRTTVENQVKDLQNGILKTQFFLYARRLEVRDVDREIDACEALPIDEDAESRGEGDFGKVYAFKILEEYKGEGFQALEVRSSSFVRY